MASRTATELVHPDRGELRFTDVAAALSDPVRLAIVARLAQVAPDGELACGTFALPVSKSTQSGHFRTLREAGVIRQRDEGTRRLNRLRRDDLDALFPGLLDLAIAQGHRELSSWSAAEDARADAPAGGRTR
ncbi:helix-turn-helix transcriptional regulator [Rugosimonospora acidiphila]|uniref:Helix-turn-helix transcriptional regulator n=1 Tax=Rugosimonospora acidiphila TaxID=556531 RepID=A0ABP9RVA3_9ACTN